MGFFNNIQQEETLDIIQEETLDNMQEEKKLLDSSKLERVSKEIEERISEATKKKNNSIRVLEVRIANAQKEIEEAENEIDELINSNSSDSKAYSSAKDKKEFAEKRLEIQKEHLERARERKILTSEDFNNLTFSITNAYCNIRTDAKDIIKASYKNLVSLTDELKNIKDSENKAFIRVYTMHGLTGIDSYHSQEERILQFFEEVEKAYKNYIL